jgi:hypothetical protein
MSVTFSDTAWPFTSVTVHLREHIVQATVQWCFLDRTAHEIPVVTNRFPSKKTGLLKSKALPPIDQANRNHGHVLLFTAVNVSADSD